MWPFSKPGSTPPKTWYAHLSALRDRVEALESISEQRYAELKQLRGLVHAMRAKDDPGPTNGTEPTLEPEVNPAHFQRAVPAQLRRRIRGF